MADLQRFDYNGLTIQRRADGYLSLTQMCVANGKRVNDFLRLSTTKAYIDELSATTGIPAVKLVETKEGGLGGTWGHQLLALRCAQWISPKFAVWCDAHIFNLMATGSTSLDINPIEDQDVSVSAPRALPRRDTVEYIEAAKTLDTFPDSTLKMLLRDSLIDELELQRNNNLLPGTKKRYTIVKVRAKELGYSTKQIGSGSGLGAFVAKRIDFSHKEGVGRYSVNHFEVTPELDLTIHEYFGQKEIKEINNTLTLVK